MVRRNIPALTEATPRVFAEALCLIREQFGCSSWGEFSYKLEETTGVYLAQGTLQHLGPTYRRVGGPDTDLLVNLEAVKVLTFANGKPVTATALLEIFYGRRDAEGNLLVKEDA